VKLRVHYGPIVALVGTLRSSMLTSNQYEELLRARGVDGFMTRLRETSYGPLLSKLPLRIKTEDVEKALLTHYYQLLEKVAVATPQFSKKFLKAFLRKHELNCLKAIIKAIVCNVDVEEALRVIVPVGRYDLNTCRIILEARDISRVFEFLEPDLVNNIAITVKSLEKTSSTVPLEAAIDKYAVVQLWNSLREVSGYDREVAEHLIGVEVDSVNVMSVLRMRELGMKTEDVEKLLTPCYYYVPHNSLISMSLASSTLEAIEFLKDSPYRPLAIKASKEPDHALSILEVGFKRHLAEDCEKALLGDRFHLGTLISFLNLKFYEVFDLITMLNGKVEGFEIREIREALILHQNMKS